MTKEQIVDFDRFLKIRDMYKLFYDSLKKCPIDTAYSSRETYLPRVPSSLVLSYGFYQTRNINNIKESDWTLLRNEWIDYAYKSGSLDPCLEGIKPINIVSAINSIFNGKQFRGVLRTSSSVLERIAAEAKQIQDTREKQIKTENDSEEAKLRKILDQTPMLHPDVKFNKVAFNGMVTLAKTRFFNSDEANHSKKLIRKKANAVVNCTNGNNITDLFECISDLVDLYEEYKKNYENYLSSESNKFEEDKKQYILDYQAYLEEREQAEKRLEQIEKLRNLNLLSDQEKAKDQDPEVPDVPTKEPETADQVVALKIRKNASVKVGDNQIYMSKGRNYTISFGSNIDAMIFERNLKMFELVLSGGNLCLRFNNTAANELMVRNYQSRPKLAIFSKELVEYVQSFHKVNYEKLLAYVDISCAPDSVTCKIISVKNAKG